MAYIPIAGLEKPKTTGYIPISGLPTPVSTPTKSKPFAPGQIQSYPVGGYVEASGYGASFKVDPYSKRPLLAQTNKQGTVLPDRVAAKFDITKPTVLTRAVLSNGRMPVSASEAIRKKLGMGLDSQLDHVISLQLSGSNLETNLSPVKTVNGKQPLVGLENELGRKVVKGEMSLLDAQRRLAAAKGITLKEDAKDSVGYIPIKFNTNFKQPGLTDFGVRGNPEAAGNFIGGIKGLGTAIVEQYTKPADLTRQVEKVFQLNSKTAPIPALQPVEDTVNFLAKVFVRTFTPMVAPLGKDIGERILLREILPKIQSGEIPANVINEFETLNKTAPQIVGDVATAVLAAYSPTLFKGQIGLFKNAPIKAAIFGGAIRGGETGLGFGTAQALSSGTKDQKEFASIVATNVAAMGVLGAITSGVIPVTKGLYEKVVQAQAELEQVLIAKGYSAAEARALARRGGYIGKLPDKNNPDPTSLDPLASLRKERGFVASVKEALPEIKVAGQYIPRSTDKLATKAVNLIKEDLPAAEKMALELNDKGTAVASELLKHYDAQATLATDQTVKDALQQKAADLANFKARQLTEAGRTVQAASILGRLTPEGQVRFAAREIQKYNEAIDASGGGFLGLKKKIPELTGEQFKEITGEMKAIGLMPDGIDKIMRFQKLQNQIQDLVPTPLFKKITAIWKAGLLTGLKTTGVNVLSNVSHFGSEIVKDIPATAIDSVASLFTGVRTKTLTLKGTGGGIQEGFQKGLQYLKTGLDERGMGIKLDYNRVNFGKGKVAKALQTYEEAVFHLLGAEDQPFYYGAKARSLADQALAQAKNAKLKGVEAQKFVDNLIQNPTDEMVRYAVLDAETSVYQNKTALGEAAKKIQDIGGGAGNIVVPFGRTPSAVAMQILNYSPVGIVKTILENIGKGKFDQRLLSQGLGRGLTGTGALFVGMELFKKGMVSLDRPKGEAEQKLWEQEGRIPNSIKFGGKWISIQVGGPLGNILLVGAHFQDALNNSGSATEAMTTALAGSAKSFSEQTFLTGINQAVSALGDPQGYAYGYLGSLSGSVVPTFVADVARATDTRERRAETILQKVMTRVPGFREQLQPQVTVLGQERNKVGSFLDVMINPLRPSPIINTPVTTELRRLWDAKVKVSPTLLGSKTGYAGLTQQQNTELWKRAGEITNAKLVSLFQNPEYTKLSDEGKGKIINSFVGQSQLNARVGMVIDVTKDLQGEELKAKLSELKKSGLLNNEVFNKYIELR